LSLSDLDRLRLRSLLNQFLTGGKPEETKKGFAKSLDEWLGVALKLMLAVLAIALIINFAIEVYTPVYRITTFQVSKDLVQTGYTGEAMREAYVYELTRIVAESNSELRRIARFDTVDKRFDFQIPRTSFSFQALVEYFRDWIGPGDVILTAAVLKHGPKWRMVTLISDPKATAPYDNLESESDDPTTLVRENALRAMTALDPYVAGNFLLRQEETTCSPNCNVDSFAIASEVLEQAAQSKQRAIRYGALLSLAHESAIANDHESALQYASAAIETWDTRMDAYEVKGVELTKLGESDRKLWEDARKSFQKARQMRKDLPFTYVDEAALDMRDEKVKDAIDLDLQALHYWPNYPDGNSALGYAYYRNGEFANAVKYLSKAVMLEPRVDRHHRDLGNALREMATQQRKNAGGGPKRAGQPTYDAALAQNLQAVTLAERNHVDRLKLAYAHLDYAKTLAESGNIKRALTEVDNAICAESSYRGSYDTGQSIEKRQVPPPALSRYSSYTAVGIECASLSSGGHN
jgi:tetratricopeptide (TPR) repeat protein